MQKTSQNKNIIFIKSKSLSPLQANDPVRIQFGKKWVPGKVIQCKDTKWHNLLPQ
jgi:hypothetical protein